MSLSSFPQADSRATPSKDKACYGGVVPGDFQSQAKDTAARDYMPADDSGCKYHLYRFESKL